ncbi:MAG: terminase small subunit, partial [Gorillibacterium sp.]|nr:terminase small subunit [Gorillibacterium sp.]
YLIDLNATAAYRRAGYTAKGNAAEVNAHRLLSNTKVQEAIQKAMGAREKRTEITQDRVLQELAKIGFADIKDYLSFGTEKQAVGATDDGELVFGYKDVIELRPSDQVDGAVISEVKYTRDGIAFKLHDKVAALEKLGRHLGMFVDKVKISGHITSDVEITIGVEEYET